MKTITKYPQQDLCTLKDDLKGLSWDDFHCSYPQVYAKCVQQAISEQNGECAYTEIPLPDKSQHLDHYKKKAIFPELTFDWNNLFAAVKNVRFGADFKDKYINGKNCKTVYSKLLCPTLDNIEEYFTYSLDGSILPSANCPDKAKAEFTIKVFNLNDDALVSRRHALILQMLGIQDKDILLTVFAKSGFSSLVKCFAEIIDSKNRLL